MALVELPPADATRDLIARLRETSPDFGGLVDRFGHAALAFRQLGLVQWQAGRLDTSVEAFLAALSLMPENADIWRDLAGVYGATDRTDLAESAIKTSLVLNARHAQSWLILAGLLDRRDDVDNAEVAYGHAIDFEPSMAAAHFGLGLLFFKRKRYHEAAEALSVAVVHDPGNGFAQACLGHVLYINADFAGSGRAFDAAAALGPLDGESQRKRARALTFQTMIDGHLQDALRDYPGLAGTEREDIDTIIRDAFSLFSAAGHLRVAAKLGRMRLAERPDDPVRRYLLEAVSGGMLTVSPPDYVEAYFDQFAPQFDQKLVGALHYVAPGVMVDCIARHRTRFTCMLDLGCGTGLAAEGLAGFGAALIGVDLSAGMLAEAEKRGLYSDLVKAEAIAFLDRSASRFDLVFATDLLIYIGDLSAFMKAASGAIVTGGFLALSLETGCGADFTLLPSGRFAHARDYIESLVASDFTILEIIDHDIRLEAGQPVPGLYLVLERR